MVNKNLILIVIHGRGLRLIGNQNSSECRTACGDMKWSEFSTEANYEVR